MLYYECIYSFRIILRFEMKSPASSWSAVYDRISINNFYVI